MVCIALTVLAVAVLVPMMFLIAGDVIGRYLLKKPIPGVFEINSYYLMVLVVFFPLAYVQRRRQHVFVTLFTERFSQRARSALDAVACLIGIVTFGLVAWYGLKVALVSTSVRDMIEGIINVPIWISKWFVPTGAFALCLQLLLDAILHLHEAATGRPWEWRQ
jgi:TRAP-type C4-dicarboxylate transport system permease small subunit